MNKPILSIIVPAFNSFGFIRDCLECLKRERCEGVELILIDGGSTDGTLDVCLEYKRMFSVFVSEQDAGQSDAINKGFRWASGKYVTWMNSDDMFVPGALREVVRRLGRSEEEWIALNTMYIDERSQILRCCRSGGFEEFALKFGVLNVFGPSTIVKRDLLGELGGLRVDYHYCMDTEYWWRMVSNGKRYVRWELYLWAFRLHGAAKTSSVIMHGICPPAMLTERNRIQKSYFAAVSRIQRKRGIWLVRAWRLIRLAYLKAYLDTLRLKGRNVINVSLYEVS